jgi:transposase-like protein
VSKGSTPRPLSVDRDKFNAAWETTFRSEVCPECDSLNWIHAHGNSACGMEADYKLCKDCGHQWDIL